jgi:hypothetical protein
VHFEGDGTSKECDIMGKLDHIVAALEGRKNPRPRIEMVLTDPKSDEISAQLDDRTNEILGALAQVLQQLQSAATRDNLTALTEALARIQIPVPKVDLTPLLAAIEKLAEQKPREWKFKIKRNAVGGISEIVATGD